MSGPWNNNLFRKILQITVLLLLAYMVIRLWGDPDYIADFEAYCPFGGMQAFTSFLVTNTLACSMTETQIFMGLLLIAGVVLFSKLFCSYLCPLGTVTEWLGRLGQKMNIYFTLNGWADRGLRILKYALLFGTFYFTLNSSELFCKEYDPYYAIFTGFGHDVVLWFALPAVIVTFLGSVFIRQFWCKYLCPLGAATNIFAYAVPVAFILLVYVVLVFLGIEISWLWPAAAVILLGFVMEVSRLKGWLLPPLKITRDESLCTDCKICDESCPMGIEISEQNPVRHIDCHLCGDCLYACPEGEVLQINKRDRKWVPASATLTLIVIGLLLSKTIELPTINMRWGDETRLNSAAVFSQQGLKNVKCYGSSMSFATKMKRVDGVLGVETFVKSHTVKVYYDPAMLDDGKIKSAIFTPTRTLLRRPSASAGGISAVDMKIEKLFDSYDTFYLTRLLAQTEGVLGFATYFGEPVGATVFYLDSLISADSLKRIIESPQLTYKLRGKEYTQSLSFSVSWYAEKDSKIGIQDFFSQMFIPFDMTFNRYKTYSPEQLSVYRVAMPQALQAGLRRSMNMLVSHLSGDDYVVRFETIYTGRPWANIYYVTAKTSPDSIAGALRQPQLTVHYRNGKTGKVANPFKFPGPGKVYSLKE